MATQGNLFADRDAAFQRIEERYAGFLQAMREEAVKICHRVGSVTIDDLRHIARIRGLDDDVDGHVWGVIFKETNAQKKPVWRALRREPSVRRPNNGRLITVWTLR
jgi:hypothetical protein